MESRTTSIVNRKGYGILENPRLLCNIFNNMYDARRLACIRYGGDRVVVVYLLGDHGSI